MGFSAFSWKLIFIMVHDMIRMARVIGLTEKAKSEG